MDNRYYNYNCPPLMNDGRFISNYIRSSTYDQYIKNINKIQSAHDYRHYLQNNGEQIIDKIKTELRENNSCGVDGRCLPMNNNNTSISSDPNTAKWYEQLSDYSTQDPTYMPIANIQ